MNLCTKWGRLKIKNKKVMPIMVKNSKFCSLSLEHYIYTSGHATVHVYTSNTNMQYFVHMWKTWDPLFLLVCYLLGR